MFVCFDFPTFSNSKCFAIDAKQRSKAMDEARVRKEKETTNAHKQTNKEKGRGGGRKQYVVIQMGISCS